MSVETLPLTTIGIIIVLAIGLSIIVKRLGFNAVLGYILAGFLLGPVLLDFLHPTDSLVVGFGEMGLFILLFYLGLELNVKDFLKAGSASLGLALLNMGGLTITGFIIMTLFGFSPLFSIVVGFMLFCTSTAVVAKFVIDQKLFKDVPAKLAVSILILQDFLGILLLVLATSLGGAEGDPLQLALSAVMFAVAAFFVVYYLSKWVENWLTEHEFGHTEVTLYAMGIGLVVATLASVLDLSIALGAYFAGFALGATAHGIRIKNDVNFLRDFFLVFFFVAFGTTIFYNFTSNAIVIPAFDQLLLYAGIGIVLTIGIVITNLIVFSIFGPLFGLTKHDASKTAILLTPLGEFVVIIATAAAGVLPPEEASVIATIAFVVIAITVIAFQPLYNNIGFHRKIAAMLPSPFKTKHTKTKLKAHTPDAIRLSESVAFNAFIILAMAWVGVLLFDKLPAFGVPILYSREVTTLLIFLAFAVIPLMRLLKALKRLLFGHLRK